MSKMSKTDKYPASVDLNALMKRIEVLESDRQLIADLERDNKALKEQTLQNFKKVTEDREALRESCVFSARLKTKQDLSADKPPFKIIDECIKVYRASRAFDATTCRFTAPVNGHYNMDLGLRQDDKKGSLEVMLMVGANGESNHAYIGFTRGPLTVCHKTMVLTLKRGDTVHGVVRRVSGEARILWCAFHGTLIASMNGNSPTPSAPPAGS